VNVFQVSEDVMGAIGEATRADVLRVSIRFSAKSGLRSELFV
jgi:hypothetical protein